MVTKWGLSDRLGPLTYAEEAGEVFLGRSVTQHKQVSDETARLIDEEVRRVIDTNYKRARDILTANRPKLDVMAQALIKYETLTEDQLKDILAGREPKPPADWDDSTPVRPTKTQDTPGPAIGTTPAGQT
jgi:cell division protease FtsH